MNARNKQFWITGLLACLLLGGSYPLNAQHCGVERWSVKTGTDPDASNVNLSSPQSATIAQLRALAPPKPIPPNSRFGPTESTVFVVTATLTEYKMEGGAHGDSDYHLVLQDDQGNTMVAEIPLPNCVGDGSPFAAQIASARQEFDSHYSATTSFQTANVPVRVTGVGFFDFAHGQHGEAPNVLELHPVLKIEFNPAAAPTPDFSLSITPATLMVAQGGSTSASIQVAAVGGSGSSPTLALSSLPPGLTGRITQIDSARASLSLAASSGTAIGSFPVTVTGTADGKTHSQTLQLQVLQASAPPTGQQWEYMLISANSEQDVVDQANRLGAEDWELISVVRVQTTPAWKAFFKRPKNNF